MTQTQRERAPRRDKVYSTNAERHRAHRARKKLAREVDARVAAMVVDLARVIRSLAIANPKTYGDLGKSSDVQIIEQLALEVREGKGLLWAALERVASIREESEVNG
jgi:hypothetical protein